MAPILLLFVAALAAPARATEPPPPDPAAAAVLSATVGFGSGHYYAGRPAQGTFFLGTQAAGVAMALAASQGGGAVDSADRGPAWGLGIGLFVVSRTVEILLAPYATHRSGGERRASALDPQDVMRARSVLARVQLELGFSADADDLERSVRALARLIEQGVIPEAALIAMKRAHVPGERRLYTLLARVYDL